MCGLCGDYDGNPNNDFTKPDGSLAGNSDQFGNSWQTEEDEDYAYVFLHIFSSIWGCESQHIFCLVAQI